MNKGQRKGQSPKRRSSSTGSRLSRADRETFSQLDKLVELQRRREALVKSMPAGITTTQHLSAGGIVVYRFAHEALGELGLLKIAPVPSVPTMCQVGVEIAPGDPDSGRWDEKYTLFKQVATLCIEALSPSDTVSSPLPELEEARLQRRLYLRFLACSHSIDMFGLAKSLSEAEYNTLLAAIENALRTASSSDRRGIEQRQQELEFYWQDLQTRPEVDGC